MLDKSKVLPGMIGRYRLQDIRLMMAYCGCAGATSSTLQKNYSGLCSRLSGIASCVAIAVGLTVLAAGWGIRLPFGFAQ